MLRVGRCLDITDVQEKGHKVFLCMMANGRLQQEGLEFQAGLVYTGKPCHKL